MAASSSAWLEALGAKHSPPVLAWVTSSHMHVEGASQVPGKLQEEAVKPSHLYCIVSSPTHGLPGESG